MLKKLIQKLEKIFTFQDLNVVMRDSIQRKEFLVSPFLSAMSRIRRSEAEMGHDRVMSRGQQGQPIGRMAQPTQTQPFAPMMRGGIQHEQQSKQPPMTLAALMQAVRTQQQN